jgi:hypothetical protein
MLHDIFEPLRIYDDVDDELDLIAPRQKRAVWRHKNIGPNFMRFGRRIKYSGADLNNWVNRQRVTTNDAA